MDDDNEIVCDVWESVESAYEYVSDVYLEAKAASKRFNNVLDFSQCTKPIREMIIEIESDLGNLERMRSPINDLIEFTQPSSGFTVLESLRSSGVKLIGMMQVIAGSVSPQLLEIPRDLFVDWEGDEIWKRYAHCKSVPQCMEGESAKSIARMYQEVYFDLSETEIERRIETELDRIWLALPGFIASKQLARLSRSTSDAIDSEDGLYRSKKLFVWCGKRYEWLTDQMMDALDLLMASTRRGTRVTADEMKGRIGYIPLDGFKTIFKVDRKRWPPKHPVHEIVGGNANSGWYLIRPTS